GLRAARPAGRGRRSVRAGQRGRARGGPRALALRDAARGVGGRARPSPRALVETLMARICIVTAGHLSTCPRMLKAADALAAAGHRVRVVSARYIDWAVAADLEVGRSRPGSWAWTMVDAGRRVGR